MRYLWLLAITGCIGLTACRDTAPDAMVADVQFVENKQMLPPDERFGELFERVQLEQVFPDGKTFVDCIPKYPTDQILAEYNQTKDEAGFDLKAFVQEHFELPPTYATDFETNASRSAGEHIEALWPVLTRQPDAESSGSLIELPHPYIVPGGRFREIYYWDSYFTMLGLEVSGHVDMIENMVRNFAYLIDTIGFIPNGNRTYYLTRSQPPFFAAMVSLLAEARGDSMVLVNYLPQLRAEYDWWMDGAAEVSAGNPAVLHVVRLPDGSILNRYYDRGDYPRAESYREDVETAAQSDRPKEEVYRHLRSGAESGWDFSSRWLADGSTLSTIHTTDIIPVDLNALLYNLERTLERAYILAGQEQEATAMAEAAEARRAAINRYCWDAGQGFFQDYDFKAQAMTNRLSLAGLYPLFFRVANEQQARGVAKLTEERFVRPGGAVSTLRETGQQWDFPNGWPPLQWITIQGLRNYGHDAVANRLARNWIEINTRVYRNVGKMVEKYNVIDMTLEAGGGEYPVQDGFGWSNGVMLRLLEERGGRREE